jgi:hypothetical protein
MEGDKMTHTLKITLTDNATFTQRVSSHRRGAALLKFDIADEYSEDIAKFKGINIKADGDDNYVVYHGVRMTNDDFNAMVWKIEIVGCED